MRDFNEGTKGKTGSDFDQAAVRKNLAIIELARHLARISAETDYKAFLNSLEAKYNVPNQKGTP